jgi:two-component sensor histidine kinase
MTPLQIPTRENLLHVQRRIDELSRKLHELVAADPRLKCDRQALLQAVEQELDRLYEAKRHILAALDGQKPRTRRMKP